MSVQEIGVIDFGMGNLGAIPNILKKCGVQARIVSSPENIDQVNKLILPGVGAFGRAIDRLAELEFVDALNRRVIDQKIPILGICLGMQLFADKSDEAPGQKGLGWIPGNIAKFEFSSHPDKLKVPHMGWNIANATPDTPLFSGLKDPRFYFVHSYYYQPEDPQTVIATAEYGHSFACAVARDNIWGVQFHPEKSHRFGLQLLKNFVEL